MPTKKKKTSTHKPAAKKASPAKAAKASKPSKAKPAVKASAPSKTKKKVTAPTPAILAKGKAVAQAVLKSSAKPSKAAPAPVVAKEKAGAKAPKSSTCGFTGCSLPATTENYCRLHYMMAFQATQLAHRKEAQTRLKGLVQELSEKYPDEYMELLKGDMSNDANFRQALQDLETGDEDLGGEGIAPTHDNDEE